MQVSKAWLNRDKICTTFDLSLFFGRLGKKQTTAGTHWMRLQDVGKFGYFGQSRIIKLI
jgi:hypothetical protein